MSLPAPSQLPFLTQTQHSSLLSLLFEPSAGLQKLCFGFLKTMEFEGYDGVVEEVRKRLLVVHQQQQQQQQQEGGDELLLGILSAHPRLGEKKVESLCSREEQASLGLKTGEGEELRGLNGLYEERFPGMRYVVFVNGRIRTEIMEDMKRRIARGDIEAEKIDAINAMCDIAKDRALKLT